MRNKLNRHGIILELIKMKVIANQDELLKLLNDNGLYITQATLSRDLKALKITKLPLADGHYKYVLPAHSKNIANVKNGNRQEFAETVMNIEFSGNLAVIKTKPGYASAIAWNIDNYPNSAILGTVGGDDTVLAVLRQGISHIEVQKILKIILK